MNIKITDEMVLKQAQAGYIAGAKSWRPAPCSYCDGTDFVWVQSGQGELTRQCAKCEPWKCGACEGVGYFLHIESGKLRRACKICERERRHPKLRDE